MSPASSRPCARAASPSPTRVGNGVADDKLIYSYLPELIRFYLDEDPILGNVDTFRCDEAGALQHVLDHLDEMVVKPVDGSGGKGLVVGPQGGRRRRSTGCARSSSADPRGWIAQPVVQLSTVPTFIDGRLAPRHVDLRPFAVNDGERVRVLPGGLTRVALPEGELVVNSSQGGGSKDTWVLSDRPARRRTASNRPPDNREVVVMSAPTASHEDSMRAQQQQQQQAARARRPGRPVLSRIAESLFWIGRYTERADGTARIVDVLRLQLLEDPGADEAHRVADRALA